MKRLTRWLILTSVTSIVLALTAALICAVSSQGAVAASTDVLSLETERQGPPSALLEPELAKALATATPDERLNVIIEMREQVAPDAFVANRTTELSTARRRMVNAMQSTAGRSQASVRTYLAARWLEGDVERVRPFWIFNGLAVNGAHPDIVRALATRPDVALIRLDHWRRWIDAPPNPQSPIPNTQYPIPSTQSPLSPTWGIQRTRADAVWNNLGISGTGVIVANIDTGVDWLHPALQANYRGYSLKGFHQHEGNWYDATGVGALYPVDGHGHGTHTMGTIVGQGGIGVAPGARWIAVRAFGSSGYGADSWIHAAFEWLLAPNGDPDLAPQVVNNSWGNNVGARKTFEHDLEALRAAGIFAVFSAGNQGPDPGTVGSPASLPGAFAVGAADPDDEVAGFSSRGPSPWGEVRPHVVAPGVHVNSSLPGGAYGERQGTSMAAPHIAGTAALILSAQSDGPTEFQALSITRTAFVLTSTAVPLTEVIPNNDSGYGLVDAYAAVALAANAGLMSGTVRSGGQPLAGASVQATPAINGGQGSESAPLGRVTTSDDDGHYQLFLGAGYYDLTASAFGYAPASAHALPIVTGTTTVQDFNLMPLPTGRLRGTVTAANGGAVEATVSVLGTPVATTTSDGSYELTLPAGNYTLEARALGYRVMTANVTVSVGQSTSYHFVLPETMRILLVDSGSRYYGSQIAYYRQALDDLHYAYDVASLKHLPEDLPSIAELRSYDLLVWSAPEDSPATVSAENLMVDYLDSGRNLLLSGQDVAYFDGGDWALSYYLDYFYAVMRSDNAASRQVVCLDDGALGSMALAIEGEGGADNQRWPDALGVLDPDYASSACHYVGGQGAVIQVDVCSPYRVLNMGFGFEGINAAADRANFMARALNWFGRPRQQAGIELVHQTAPVQVAPPGGVVTHTVRLRNTGEVGTGDTMRVEVNGDDWPATVLTYTDDLAPCAMTTIDLRVEIPPTVTWNAFDTVTLTVHSSVSPTLSQAMTLTSKAPAPVLLVDDDRWYDQEQVYEEALHAAGLSYDYWDVAPKGFYGAGSPSAEVLTWYSVVLWFTGYDWYDPIHSNELPRLTNYLDNGGRLFLSSQDYLRHIGPVTLTHDYFGVIDYSDVLSQTMVQGVPGHVLGDGLGPVKLTYPFNNWSSSVLPAPSSQIAFRGQHGQAGAVTQEGPCNVSSPGTGQPDTEEPCWRTAFFAFPFEALPQETRLPLISRLVGWLSWLGQSDLQAERTVARVGDTVGYTLTLRNDGRDTVVAAAVSNTLPAGTTLATGPTGGASLVNGRVTWSGDLAPGTGVTFTYRLSLTGGSTAIGVIRNTADITVGLQGLYFRRGANVRIAAPELGASNLTMTPTATKASAEVWTTLVLRNDGLDDAPNVRVDHPLPWSLRLVSGTLSSGGLGITTELPAENRVRWTGTVSAGVPVTLSYCAIAPPALEQATWVYNAAHLEDGLGGAWERGGWLYVTPHRFYLPLLTKSQ